MKDRNRLTNSILILPVYFQTTDMLSHLKKLVIFCNGSTESDRCLLPESPSYFLT